MHLDQSSLSPCLYLISEDELISKNIEAVKNFRLTCTVVERVHQTPPYPRGCFK